MARTAQNDRTAREQTEYEIASGRPLPDEAPLDEEHERSAADTGVTDLSWRDWIDIVKRAAKNTIGDNMPMIAQALAYSTFMAIPAVLLVVLGGFTPVAGPQTITS